MKKKADAPNTIVHYTAAEAPFNGYPQRIVSPPLSGSCCLEEMELVGSIHWEDDTPYIYRRCPICGHTVRHFLEDGAKHFTDFSVY